MDRVDAGGRAVEARLPWQADDIDGVTRLVVPAEARVTPGRFLDVRVDEVVDDYDFAATLLRVADAPVAAVAQPPRRRALPMATVGSFGR